MDVEFWKSVLATAIGGIMVELIKLIVAILTEDKH
jgi:hypothetical protein